MPSESSNAEYLSLTVVGLCGVIAMLMGARFEPDWWAKAVSGLGDALLIAALVGAFVELRLLRMSMERLVAAAGEAFRAIQGASVRPLKSYIDPKKVDDLEREMLSPIFFRQGMKILISLELQKWPRAVKGTVALEYHVVNISDESASFKVRLDLDELYGAGSSGLTAAQINDDKPIDFSKLPLGTTLARQSNLVRFTHLVTIPARSGITVRLNGFQTMSEEDVWPWDMTNVMDGLHVTVTYPANDLDVSFTAKHPRDFKLTANAGTLVAELKEIMLPGQGFDVRWRLPAPPSPPPAAPTLPAGPLAPGAQGKAAADAASSPTGADGKPGSDPATRNAS